MLATMLVRTLGWRVSPGARCLVVMPSVSMDISASFLVGDDVGLELRFKDDALDWVPVTLEAAVSRRVGGAREEDDMGRWTRRTGRGVTSLTGIGALWALESLSWSAVCGRS